MQLGDRVEHDQTLVAAGIWTPRTVFAVDVWIYGDGVSMIDHFHDRSSGSKDRRNDERQSGAVQRPCSRESRVESSKRQSDGLVISALCLDVIDAHEPPLATRRHSPVMTAEPDWHVFDLVRGQSPHAESVGDLRVREIIGSGEHDGSSSSTGRPARWPARRRDRVAGAAHQRHRSSGIAVKTSSRCASNTIHAPAASSLSSCPGAHPA